MDQLLLAFSLIEYLFCFLTVLTLSYKECKQQDVSFGSRLKSHMATCHDVTLVIYIPLLACSTNERRDTMLTRLYFPDNKFSVFSGSILRGHARIPPLGGDCGALRAETAIRAIGRTRLTAPESRRSRNEGHRGCHPSSIRPWHGHQRRRYATVRIYAPANRVERRWVVWIASFINGVRSVR